jgi:hypothetical protein
MIKRYTGKLFDMDGGWYSDPTLSTSWVQASDCAKLERELADMTAMRNGFKAACDLFLDDIKKLQIGLDTL